MAHKERDDCIVSHPFLQGSAQNYISNEQTSNRAHDTISLKT
jgi:hypothetical protein